jgi:hypothetical protein
MKEKTADLTKTRRRLVQQMPDPTIALSGSLMHRMVHCYKAGCRACQEGKGHGPIWILSVSQGKRRVRQITVPKELKKEVQAGLGRFATIQKLLKRIGRINQALLEERKRG